MVYFTPPIGNYKQVKTSVHRQPDRTAPTHLQVLRPQIAIPRLLAVIPAPGTSDWVLAAHHVSSQRRGPCAMIGRPAGVSNDRAAGPTVNLSSGPEADDIVERDDTLVEGKHSTRWPRALTSCMG